MPFADIGGLVSGGVEQDGMGDVVGWERSVIVNYAIEMVIAASQESGAAGRAKGQGDERIAKAHAFGGETIHVWRGEPGEAGALAVFALDNSHGVPTLVIGVDEQEVGFALVRVESAGRGDEGEKNAETGTF